MGGPETTTPTLYLLHPGPVRSRTQTPVLVIKVTRSLSRNDDPARRLTRQSRAPTVQPPLRTGVHPRTAQHGHRRAPISPTRRTALHIAASRG